MKKVTVQLLDKNEDWMAIRAGFVWKILGDECVWFSNDEDLAYTLEMICTGQYRDIVYE